MLQIRFIFYHFWKMSYFDVCRRYFANEIIKHLNLEDLESLMMNFHRFQKVFRRIFSGSSRVPSSTRRHILFGIESYEKNFLSKNKKKLEKLQFSSTTSRSFIKVQVFVICSFWEIEFFCKTRILESLKLAQLTAFVSQFFRLVVTLGFFARILIKAWFSTYVYTSKEKILSYKTADQLKPIISNTKFSIQLIFEYLCLV